MGLECLRALWVRGVAVAGALGIAIVTVLLTPLAADAVARTSTGVRCTVVGTFGADVLTGTAARDVICGRGGNDLLSGRGGNDLIDGGGGNDSLVGAGGTDVLYGGPGSDALDGGVGGDRLYGGLDNDGLRGMDGDDDLRGGPGRDTVTGEAGGDVISGDGGNDDLRGGTGADRIYGGDGADLEAGNDGNDFVSGNLGDDDLSGGTGADVVDGGGGFNVCDVPGAIGDKQFRCVVDTSKPVIGAVTLSPTMVDVSSAAQTIRVQAHVTDDTGVKSVQIGSAASLVSGTARDGTWATTIEVPRFIAPGPRDIDLFVRDRVGRDTSQTHADAYTVVNTVYDQEMPVLQSLSLTPSSVDVRTAAATISTTVRVTDDLAGPTDLYVCPAHAMSTGTPTFRQADACMPMLDVSGTASDSTWTGTLTIPQGAPSGTWNVEVWISDAAGNFANDFWFGPDEFATRDSTNEPRYKAIPHEAGAFTVVGSTPDTDAPALTTLNLTPSTVDTSTGAVTVTAEIAGTDAEGITGADVFISGYAGYPNNPSWTDYVDIANVEDFERVSGTAQDGVLRATFVVAGGTPDGTYFIQAVLEDSGHFESWVSSDSGWTTDNHLLAETLAPTGTHFVVANSN